MLFNSFAFWLFYVVILTLYYRLGHRGQNVLLLAGSYFFYGCWDWRFLGLIMLSTVMDWLIGLAIDAVPDRVQKKRILWVSVIANLGILGFFKYFGFFSSQLGDLLTAVGMPAMIPTLSIVLPVGVSFYTFQSMSYTIDVYRGDVKATRSLLDFAVFVAFFPQLVAGPIERAADFLPQVIRPRVMTPHLFKQGLYLIMSGLFRKMFIADNLAPIVNTIFATPTQDLSGAEILLGIYAFAFQIYGDFSGYSAIARGVANWMGFELSANFKNPYFAISPSDFWQRWHISLSQWLRDYLYIPLGGNRQGSLFTYRNLLLTMLLGGLWHGANWTFIAWGAFHGTLLCGWRAIEAHFKKGRRAASAAEQTSPTLGSLIYVCRVLIMFHLICFSWLLFRAETMTQVGEMLVRMTTDFTITPFVQMTFGLLVFFVAPLMLYEAWLEKKHDLMSLLNVHWAVRGLAYLYVFYMIILFPPMLPSGFIYFQF
ncbi:MBOAT family O-acyltransferase [Planctomicrobium piriforme]|uniref:D-alanyl-lipoteichoic acid acyltransferase DltB, MBOAT superfamily n=1 Tax=Planctomicrobium piriforme TaxID=1576369 RepID=A0A1I3C351_9PLAN|nr:MBOAT family O-acyltransferase [Planctomicrobium piriforme]SFH68833.1 D-alanyl-lipoteichoic acid acyltransferase DltB, MBOAT superfamily [Planctomicrobium piriforme]